MNNVLLILKKWIKQESLISLQEVELKDGLRLVIMKLNRFLKLLILIHSSKLNTLFNLWVNLLKSKIIIQSGKLQMVVKVSQSFLLLISTTIKSPYLISKLLSTWTNNIIKPNLTSTCSQELVKDNFKSSLLELVVLCFYSPSGNSLPLIHTMRAIAKEVHLSTDLKPVEKTVN